MNERDAVGFNEYQRAALRTAVYPDRHGAVGRMYAALGVAGEAGECAELVKKMWRNHGGGLTAEMRDKIEAEIGDVFWYLAALADECNINLAEAAVRNIEKLAQRKALGQLKEHS